MKTKNSIISFIIIFTLFIGLGFFANSKLLQGYLHSFTLENIDTLEESRTKIAFEKIRNVEGESISIPFSIPKISRAENIDGIMVTMKSIPEFLELPDFSLTSLSNDNKIYSASINSECSYEICKFSMLFKDILKDRGELFYLDFPIKNTPTSSYPLELEFELFSSNTETAFVSKDHFVNLISPLTPFKLSIPMSTDEIDEQFSFPITIEGISDSGKIISSIKLYPSSFPEYLSEINFTLSNLLTNGEITQTLPLEINLEDYQDNFINIENLNLQNNFTLGNIILTANEETTFDANITIEAEITFTSEEKEFTKQSSILLKSKNDSSNNSSSEYNNNSSDNTSSDQNNSDNNNSSNGNNTSDGNSSSQSNSSNSSSETGNYNILSDINKSGCVDLMDLTILMDKWRTNGGETIFTDTNSNISYNADIVVDREVDLKDLSQLLSDWQVGETCQVY